MPTIQESVDALVVETTGLTNTVSGRITDMTNKVAAADVAKGAAENAKSGAEIARSASETAKTASETAQTLAETAKTNAETASTSAAGSSSSAGTSESNASSSATASANSATASASSASSALASKNTAEMKATQSAVSAAASEASAVDATNNGTTAANAVLSGKLDKTGGTVTGTLTLTGGNDATIPALEITTGHMHVHGSNAQIKFDEGECMITANDGQGNFQIQTGVDSAGKVVSEAGYTSGGIVKMNMNHDGMDGKWSASVAPIQNDGDAVTFANGIALTLDSTDQQLKIGIPDDLNNGYYAQNEIANTTGLNASALSYGTIPDNRLSFYDAGTSGSDPATLSIRTAAEGTTAAGTPYATLSFEVKDGENSTGALAAPFAVARISAQSYRSGTTSNEDSGIGFYTSQSNDAVPQFRGGFTNIGGFNVGNSTTRNTAVGDLHAEGNITATSFTGSGSLLTGIDFVIKAATAPSSPAAGDLWFDTTNNVMKAYSGSGWDQMSNKFSATGGSVTTYGAYKVHTFTSSGTFITEAAGIVDVLVVAGGGGTYGAQGAQGGTGGAGAGGFVYYQGLSVGIGSFSAVVGAGSSAYGSGADSSFPGIPTAPGGGGSGQSAPQAPQNGGSGGGAGFGGYVVYPEIGTGVANKGNSGGPGLSNTNNGMGGGGGGAKEPGDTDGAGQGGDGYTEGVDSVYNHNGGGTVLFSINGTGNAYAGGGGGGSINADGIPGGIGGGGAGDYRADAHHGTPNTGGGGGGGAYSVGPNSNGGSGIVIVRYLA